MCAIVSVLKPVTDKTTDWSADIRRETICCKAKTIAELAKVVSFEKWGSAACPPLPSTTISKKSEAAIRGPGLIANSPTGKLGRL